SSPIPRKCPGPRPRFVQTLSCWPLPRSLLSRRSTASVITAPENSNNGRWATLPLRHGSRSLLFSEQTSRSFPDGIGQYAAAVLSNIAVVLREGLGEDMAAGTVCDEIDVLARCRSCDRPQRRATGIINRARWQSPHDVGVEG